MLTFEQNIIAYDPLGFTIFIQFLLLLMKWEK